jgi:hypothetical protein
LANKNVSKFKNRMIDIIHFQRRKMKRGKEIEEKDEE